MDLDEWHFSGPTIASDCIDISEWRGGGRAPLAIKGHQIFQWSPQVMVAVAVKIPVLANWAVTPLQLSQTACVLLISWSPKIRAMYFSQIAHTCCDCYVNCKSGLSPTDPSMLISARRLGVVDGHWILQSRPYWRWLGLQRIKTSLDNCRKYPVLREHSVSLVAQLICVDKKCREKLVLLLGDTDPFCFHSASLPRVLASLVEECRANWTRFLWFLVYPWMNV